LHKKELEKNHIFLNSQPFFIKQGSN